ncbi:AAA family ATPase [Belnapia sp. T6]|uniref:AAA family ATPase n=2 Tax=Belnapia mucosa TaxID=2804532 RepID=A0ABS1VAH1_9PROT|nr:adenylate/guanylate cyclase domain-containing protein [Belnapia mucosa]MBL6458671.1 AAA family ATPase [Belnapia mucosa]
MSPSTSRYCDACGAPLPFACLACGHANRPGARFCGGCGRGLGETTPAAPSLPPRLAALLGSRFASEGERKQVTVLFADIRGSMELIQGLDPEQAVQRLEPALQVMAREVHQYGGTVNHMSGDGLMAVFGAPLAYEDHAVRACFAARAMIESISSLDQDQVEIRVGLNSGEVLVRTNGHDLSMEYEAVGLTTHFANRMEQLAVPGTACITARTAQLAHGFVTLRSLGPTAIKGVSRPVEVFELLGVAAQTRWQARAATQCLTPFVGRRTELAVMLEALHRAREGRGQVVTVSGEAGVGKSRLVHEFLRSPEMEGLPSISAAAMPHDRNTPYKLTAGMLRSWLTVENEDGQAEIDAKLVAATATLREGRVVDLAPLRSLLDLPVRDAGWSQLEPVQRRRRTHEAVRSLVLQAGAARPSILVVEDMHWADAESQSVLEAIVDSLGAARVLLVVTYRPEYQNQWARLSYYSLVQLGPLEAGASDRLLRSLLGDAAELESLRQRIIKQTDGMPLFLEEIARTLVETGVLVSERARYRLTRSAEEVEIPATVQTVLASRIDRLPAEERMLLQVASVIGKDVPIPLLRAVAGLSEERLVRLLLELRSQEFLYEVTESSGAEYTFKHALTHAVTYDSMLMRRRRALHGQVMCAIEENFPERIDEFTERLADHALRAAEWAKAAGYCCKAGHRANARSAHQAATTFFERALEAVHHLPAEREAVHLTIDVRLGLRIALAAAGDLEQVRKHLQEAEALARSIGDERRLMPAIISRSTILNNLGELDEAVEAGLQGRALALQLEDEACFVSSGFALGQAYWNRGEFRKAEEVLTGTIASIMKDPPKRHAGTTGTASVLCLVSLSHTYCLVGRPGPAFARAREALRIAKETGRPYDLSYAHAALGLVHLTLGELEGATRPLEEGLRIAQASEIRLLIPHVARYLGRSYALAGRVEEARTLLTEIAEQAKLQSLVALHGWCAAALGLAQLLGGAHEEAERSVGEALDFARSKGYRPLEAHASRLLGAIAARDCAGTDPVRRAEVWFQSAAEIARDLGMNPELAHCHHSLADLFAHTGRPAEARAGFGRAIELYKSCGMEGGAVAASAALAALAAGSATISAKAPLVDEPGLG